MQPERCPTCGRIRYSVFLQNLISSTPLFLFALWFWLFRPADIAVLAGAGVAFMASLALWYILGSRKPTL